MIHPKVKERAELQRTARHHAEEGGRGDILVRTVVKQREDQPSRPPAEAAADPVRRYEI